MTDQKTKKVMVEDIIIFKCLCKGVQCPYCERKSGHGEYAKCVHCGYPLISQKIEPSDEL